MGWGIMLLIITLVGAIYLNQTSKIAAVGRHVQELDYDLREIQRENAAIERDVAEAQSLDRLYKETQRMGFVAAQAADIEYIVIPDYPVDTLPVSTESARAEKPPRSVDTVREALSIVLQRRLDDLMRGEFGE